MEDKSDSDIERASPNGTYVGLFYRLIQPTISGMNATVVLNTRSESVTGILTEIMELIQ